MESSNLKPDPLSVIVDRRTQYVRSIVGMLAEFICWTLAAYALIFRFQMSPWTAIPQGQENAATVPLFNLFTVIWNAATVGRSNYWHAPIFYPTGGAFAFSEVQPTSLIVAPIVGRAPILAYNVYLVSSVAFSLLLVRRWLTFQKLSFYAAVLGGVTTLLLPFLHGELGVLQLTMLWGPIGFAWSIQNLWKAPTLSASVWCGVSFAAMYGSCHYYGMMATCVFALLLPGFAVQRALAWRLSNAPNQAIKEIGSSLLAITIAGAILLPLLSGQLKWMADSKPRTLSTVRSLSCYADDWFRTGVTAVGTIPEQFLWKGPKDSRPMGVSLGAMLLAVWGTITGLRCHKRRQVTMAFISVFVASFLLSLGPRLTIAGFEPYSFLFHNAPILKYLRSPFRFAVFGQLAITMLMAFAVDDWSRRCSDGRLVTMYSKRVVLLLLLSCFAVETWPKPSLVCKIDQRLLQPSDWTTWIQRNTQPGRPILCLPFPFRKHVQEFAPAAEWMLAATIHQRPMMGGYSGFFPASFRVTQSKLNRFPSEETYDYLRATGVEYAVIRSDLWPKMPASIRLIPVAFVDDKAGVVILRLIEI